MSDIKIEAKADASGDKLDAIMSLLGKTISRLDEMETKSNLPAPSLVTAADKKKAKKDDDMEAGDDDDEEEEYKKNDDSEAKAKKFMMRKAKKDAEHSNPKEHNEGEIKPDDEGKMEHPGHINFKKDDDEEEAKSDEDLEEEAKKADEDEASMADAQAKADSVYAAFGKSASRPLKGENLMSYRKRMARGLQAHSDAYKEVNLSAIKDAMLLNIAEKQIYADALVAAKSPTMYAADQEIELHEKDRAGRMISKFKGGFGWMDAFKVPAMRVKEFNLNNNKR